MEKAVYQPTQAQIVDMDPQPLARPRVLLVAPYFYPQNYGGAVRLYDDLLRRATRLDCAVLTEGQEMKPGTEELAIQLAHEHGYQIFRINRLALHFKSHNLVSRLVETAGFFPRVARQFRATIEAFRPDLVISGASYRLGWLMSHLPPGMPFINYIHGEEMTQNHINGGLLGRYLLRKQMDSIREARINIVVSQFTANLIADSVQLDPERVRVLPNFVDTDRFQPPADREALRRELGLTGRTVLLTIARLIPRKGIDQTLRALAGARNLPPDWIYLIGGTGREEANLRQLAGELGLAERVRFLGYLNDKDLPRYYGAADLFIQNNRMVDGDTEGFGIVFLEANACGTPVIGGIAGGTADAIEEGISGLRVDGDSIDNVRAALERLLGDSELRRRMAQTALARVRADFTAQACTHRFEDLICSLVQRT